MSDNLSPELVRAINKFKVEYNSWNSNVGEVPPYGLHTEFFCFSLNPFAKLPHDEGWIWNQTNRKQTITLEDKSELTIQKLNARKRKNYQKAPSYKVWKFKRVSSEYPLQLYGIWCEKGILLPSISSNSFPNSHPVNSNFSETTNYRIHDYNSQEPLILQMNPIKDNQKSYKFHYETGIQYDIRSQSQSQLLPLVPQKNNLFKPVAYYNFDQSNSTNINITNNNRTNTTNISNNINTSNTSSNSINRIINNTNSSNNTITLINPKHLLNPTNSIKLNHLIIPSEPTDPINPSHLSNLTNTSNQPKPINSNHGNNLINSNKQLNQLNPRIQSIQHYQTNQSKYTYTFETPKTMSKKEEHD